ncbi:antigen 43, partial [Escherichia coli]
MKTVSQNTPTIYSATTPENNPPQLVASLVPDEQRISFWPQHFGLIPQWVTLEPVSYTHLDVYKRQLRDSAKHSVSELPVNWWVQPSVIRTFSSRGDMRVGTSTAGSGMTFS